MLDEKQSQDLQQYIYELTNEAVKKAVKDAGSDKEFLSQKEMALWLGISVNTLKTYVQKGLPIIVIGGRNFYSKKEVSKFLLRQQIGGANK
ncbi:helix-turn-helix domain-containing protein [Vagococcus zengguangii]|uniref:helix-turn-helix domain-containing protein n=1 Tax=Vagococcus zengguangii TaxID=2571750 RepID=UPI002015FC9F|nr:helix-turn-helix domain-containing protein [Vagococcus zengguangii]